MLMINNLKGTIGRDHLTGYGTGTVAGNQFQGGDVFLSNSQGSIHLGIGPATTIHVGRKSTQTFAIVIVSASGKYAPFANGTGTLTKWNVPPRPGATASFSGHFNP